MNATKKHLGAGVALPAAAALLLAGCVPNVDAASDPSQNIAVTATDTECAVSMSKAEAGVITFSIKNEGSKVNEFYLLGENGLTIKTEIENIAPGTSRDLTYVADPGTYFTACKPGMVGADIGKAEFTVSGEVQALPADEQEAIDAALNEYIAYTKQQVQELLPKTEAFVKAYVAGDFDTAKTLYPTTRVHYERIEPTAEQFGDLDPRIDYRKPGAEAENIPFEGFHRIEMDMWIDAARANYPDEDIQPLTEAERAELGAGLKSAVQELHDLVTSDDFELSLADVTNGAVGLLDEVAAPDGKLPGEENEFAHTDLFDFYANVEGANVAYESVRKLAESKGETGANLVAELDKQFAAMLALLDTYGSYDKGFVNYETVTTAERNELGAQLSALSEPLSKLTNTVLGL
ncbi:iron uptake system protein EfeO [Canibacter zhoujuaniae]|uniref:iron uptake system protein EfeO n=1 Tax=Canibacter zhoujuaniae TaxID=2708343 RepID=UPI001423E57C|nr:iron uptake system protein EfeO [Canibacter zhoujuaniae]